MRGTKGLKTDCAIITLNPSEEIQDAERATPGDEYDAEWPSTSSLPRLLVNGRDLCSVN